MKLWKEYLKNHGRNLTLIRYPGFNRLVQVGLPNRLRGEVWELTCGSLFLRLGNPGVYERILKENAGRTSSSTEDIEKDLHRSSVHPSRMLRYRTDDVLLDSPSMQRIRTPSVSTRCDEFSPPTHGATLPLDTAR